MCSQQLVGEFPVLNRRGRNFSRGPGEKEGQGGTPDLGYCWGTEAGWIGKGLLCKALMYLQAYLLIPLPASAGFAGSGRVDMLPRVW